jgi:hypothetical protein
MSQTSITLSPKELSILRAVAGHAPTTRQVRASHSPSAGIHETALVEETGIPLDELMMLRRDEYDRVRKSGLIQMLSVKLLIGLTDGDQGDRFGYVWITPAGLEASHPGRQPCEKQNLQNAGAIR